jgi:hypothetical protein
LGHRIVKSSPRHAVIINNFLTNYKVHAPPSLSSTTMIMSSAPAGTLNSHIDELAFFDCVVNQVGQNQIFIFNINFSLFGGNPSPGTAQMSVAKWGRLCCAFFWRLCVKSTRTAFLKCVV